MVARPEIAARYISVRSAKSVCVVNRMEIVIEVKQVRLLPVLTILYDNLNRAALSICAWRMNHSR